jgi:hypothetical protein
MTDHNWKSVAEDGVPDEGRVVKVRGDGVACECVYKIENGEWKVMISSSWTNSISESITHYSYIDEPEQETESPKFKMLKMRHDIDNLAFMLKEHCESHPESVTEKGFGEVVHHLRVKEKRVVPAACGYWHPHHHSVNWANVNCPECLECKPFEKPVEEPPLTLDQCEVGMQLESLLGNGVYRIVDIVDSFIKLKDPISGSFPVPESAIKHWRIHKPAPAVVHYVESEDVATCGEDVATDWSLVTCADCLKHKSKGLVHYWGDDNICTCGISADDAQIKTVKRKYVTCPDCLNPKPKQLLPQIIKVGSRFDSVNPGFSGSKCFMIVGAAKASPKGECFLASTKYGWSYTGKTVPVENCHNITDEEFSQMVGGHVDRFIQHKPKTLMPSDCVGRKIRCVRVPVRGFQGYPKNWIEVGEILTCYRKGKFSFAGYPDYTLSEKDLTHFELVPEEMIEVPKSEWDKLQSDRKDVAEKLEELITILDIASQIP